MLTRTLLEWCDKKQEEAIEEDTLNKAVSKASVSGAIEGFVDASVAIGMTCVAICGVGFIIGKLKK